MSDSDQNMSEKEIFVAALELPVDQRDAYLNETCGDDEALKQAVQELLAAAGDTEGAFDTEESSPTTLSGGNGDESAGTQIGRYKLLEKLGEGGFGSVWAAEQKEPVRRRVALKIIKLGMDTKQVVARFEAERQALALMDHPNIAKVLDAGATDTGRPYFVMELVKGVAITRYCEQEKLDTNARLDLFIKVCQAIQHAHQKGIIHRDIKPSNIMVTLHDGVPVPKVIDFGIAKATQQELTEKTIYTQYSQFIGTPAYMSPEQAEMSGLDIDTRSDIYSLGVLLYELLTGSTPFDSKELMQSGLDEMRKIIREQEPVRPSTRLSQTLVAANVSSLTPDGKKVGADSSRSAGLPQIPSDLDWIVMKSLEKDRSRRYDTANGLTMDIRRHLDNEPIVARPPSATYRFQKAWRRNRLVFSAGCAVAAALLAGLTVSLWLAGLAKAESERATREEAAKEVQRREAVAKAQEAEEERQRAETVELVARRRAYASDMNLIQRSLELNDLGNARRLLNRHRPNGEGADLRGWEWRYLWKQVQDDSLFTLTKEDGTINGLAASSDGKWLAVLNERQIILWNMWSRESTSLSYSGVVGRCVAFSPVDPVLAFIATKGADLAMVIVDVTSREILCEIPVKGYIPAIEFTPDGASIVTVGANSGVQVFRVSDGRPVRKIPFEGVSRAGFGRPLAVAPEGTQVFIGMRSGEVACIDLLQDSIQWTQQIANEPILAVTVSPDGRTLAASTGALESAVVLMNRDDGAELGRLTGHRAWVGRVGFLEDGRYLASSSADQTVSIWDTKSMKRVRVLRGHEREIWAMAQLPDSRLVTGSKIGEVIVWDAMPESNSRTATLLPGTYDNLSVMEFTPDGRSIVVVNQRIGRVSLWTGDNYREEKVIHAAGERRTHAVLEPGGWRVALGRRDGQLEIVDVRDGRDIQTFDLGAGAVVPYGFNQKGDGVWLRAGGKDELEEWIFGATEPRRKVGWSFRGGFSARGVIWASSGNWLVGPEYDAPQFQFLDQTHGRVERFALHHNASMEGAISPNHQWLAISHEPGLLTVWDMGGLSQGVGPEKVVELGGAVMSYHGIAFTPDNRRMAAASGVSQMVTLWDTASFEPVLTLPGRGWGQENIAISPDGNTIISGGTALHVWTAPSMEEIEAAESTGTAWFSQQ